MVPLLREIPEGLTAVHKEIYKEILSMSLFFGEPQPIVCHDFLVCCKTNLFLSMQMNEARGWLVVGL